MPHLSNPTLEILLYSILGLILLFLGYHAGRLLATRAARKQLARKEQDLFTAQKGFKDLYERELAQAREEIAKLQDQTRLLHDHVETYRKKAAGLGGLFSSSKSRKSNALYALLLENEALEEALYAQNEKLKQERTEALQEQLRSTSYRRVLLSQLMNDDRIRSYVSELLADEQRLPKTEPVPSLPAPPGRRSNASPREG